MVCPTTNQTIVSSTAPTMKFTHVATIDPPTTATRPFTACWTAEPAPARNGSTTNATAAPASSPGPPVRDSPVRPTATTLTVAPTARPSVTPCRPAGPRPARTTRTLLRL